jgi:hypothetical protein
LLGDAVVAMNVTSESVEFSRDAVIILLREGGKRYQSTPDSVDSLRALKSGGVAENQQAKDAGPGRCGKGVTDEFMRELLWMPSMTCFAI